MQATVDALNNRTTFTYDAAGRQETVKDALGNVFTTVYDALGNVTESIDALGKRTTFTLDALYRRTEVKDALGNVFTTSYDAVGNVQATIDARGNRTTFSYDALNRREQVENALGDLSTVTYDAVGNVTASIDARGNRTTFTYDALQRRTQTEDALNNLTTVAYDAVGNVTKQTDAASKTWTFTYDALNRQETVKAPDGGVSTTVYDAVGRVVNTIDPLGNKTTYAYDALHRRTETTDAEGGMTTLVYDALGRTTGVKDPVGNFTTFVFDALGRVTDEEDPLGNSATFAYDAVGRMTSATDRLGRRRDYAYDDVGRVETEKWYDDTPTLVRTLSFTYDAANNLTSAQDPHGTYTFTYDELNRADVIQDVHGQTLTFTFDAVGNRTVVDDSQGGTTTSTYNAANLLTKREFDDGTTELRFDQTYTSRLQLEEITRYSNLSGATKVGESDITYDDNGRLENIQHKDGSSTILTNYTYTHDLSSRIDTETIDGSTKTFTYDKTNQLTDDDTNTYSYDLNGNRDMTGYQTGSGNRMTNDGTYTYTYDNAGNTIKKSKGASLETWAYEHDHRNQLTKIEKQETDGGTVLLRVEYDYDVFGRRIREDQWESATGTVTTKFSYDGDDIWLDLDGSDALKMRFIRPDGIDKLAARIDASANVGWYHADVRQSIVRLTDNSATTLNSISYDGFGKPTQTNESNGDRFLYTGRELNLKTALQYNRDRYYDSATGRWTTIDRIGFRAGDPNLYRYVVNNPVNAIDPTGQYIIAATEADYEKIEAQMPGGFKGVNVGDGQWYMQAENGPLARQWLLSQTIPNKEAIDRAAFGDPHNFHLIVWADWRIGGSNDEDYWDDKVATIQKWRRRWSGDNRNWAERQIDKAAMAGVAMGLTALTEAMKLKQTVTDHTSSPEFRSAEKMFGRVSNIMKHVPGKIGGVFAAIDAARRGGDSAEQAFDHAMNGDFKAAREKALEAAGHAAGPIGLGLDLDPKDVREFQELAKGLQNLSKASSTADKIKAGAVAIVGKDNGDRLQRAFEIKERIKGKNYEKAFSLAVDLARSELDRCKACQVNGTLGPVVEAHRAFRVGEHAHAVAEAIHRRDLEAAVKAATSLYELTTICFAAGTPILTPEGSKPIEQLRKGDRVLSSPENDPNGPVEPRVIEEVFNREAPIWNLHVNGQIIKTTKEHPFWVDGRGWTATADLKEGDRLRTHDGRWVAVEGVAESGEVATVYNLQVAEYHTYYVGRAEWGFDVWAHNSCTELITDAKTGRTTLRIRNKFDSNSPESRQLRRFVPAWNEQIDKSGGSLTRRTPSGNEKLAAAAWRQEMSDKYPKRFKNKVVGHVPDAAAGGPSAPGTAGGSDIRAMALDKPVNSYLGGLLNGVKDGTTYHRVELFR